MDDAKQEMGEWLDESGELCKCVAVGGAHFYRTTVMRFVTRLAARTFQSTDAVLYFSVATGLQRRIGISAMGDAVEC